MKQIIWLAGLMMLCGPIHADVSGKQVEIEAKIVETTESFNRDLGVQLPGFHDTNQNQDFQQDVTGLNMDAIRGIDNTTTSSGLSLQSTFLDDVQLETVLRAVEKSEQTNVMTAPRVVTANQEQAQIQAGSDVEFKDAELNLQVRPQVVPGTNRVVMEILPDLQVSDTQTSDIETDRKVPLLYKIPLIGWFFEKAEPKEKDELLVLVTPEIVKDTE